jgi:hypothetical protein
MYKAVRRARKRNQFVENVYRSKVFKRDAGICGICHEAVDPLDWHLDHVRPLARGGEHSYANTQVSHPVCNQRKSVSWNGSGDAVAACQSATDPAAACMSALAFADPQCSQHVAIGTITS